MTFKNNLKLFLNDNKKRKYCMAILLYTLTEIYTDQLEGAVEG